jgi:hypothetical protein
MLSRKAFNPPLKMPYAIARWAEEQNKMKNPRRKITLVAVLVLLLGVTAWVMHIYPMASQLSDQNKTMLNDLKPAN